MASLIHATFAADFRQIFLYQIVAPRVEEAGEVVIHLNKES
jgi:hypothetical protein